MILSKIIKEACVETVEESIHAAQNGASQLEVCSELSKDGLTPDEGLLIKIVSSVKIGIKVMIRLREGDFFYSQTELGTMIQQIQRFKTYHIDGFVFGALTKDEKGKIILDLPAIYQICKAASPHHVTIHKAIDLCDDIITEVGKLKNISNVKFILSSGGEKEAIEGQNMLIAMQKTVGKDINIIAAGKITSKNLNQIALATNLTYFHGKKIV